MRNVSNVLPVTLMELKVSAFHRSWIKLGHGVHMRARTVAQGFELRIRYGTSDRIAKSVIQVKEREIAKGMPRPALVCSGCGKFASKNLYLGSGWRWCCARCLGLKPWQLRMPMKWDLNEEVKFRQLLRRKVDQDILQFEIAALRELSVEAFFKSRPYLVPEFVDRIGAINPSLHKKLLKVLHSKYKSVMMKRRVRNMSDREGEWLMEKLQTVFTKAVIITKGDMSWLREEWKSGTKSGRSVSQQREIGCSSGRMTSGAGTSVEPAMEQETSNASSATEKASINEATGSSSAPNVTEKGK